MSALVSILLAFGAGLLAVGLLVILGVVLHRSGQRLVRRAEALLSDIGKAAAGKAGAAGRPGGGRRSKQQSTGGFDRWMTRHLPNQAMLRAKIARTGKTFSLASYVTVCLVLAGVVALTLLIVVGLPLPLAVLAGVGVGAVVPNFVLSSMAKSRQSKFVNMMPEAIDAIVRGVRSGLPVTEAMAAVGREMGDPIGIEFRRTIDSYRIGRPLPAALLETARRIDVAEFNFLVVAMSIQQETGGNLAETLANLGDIIRRRRQMRLKVKALTGEAKASAWIVGSLPFLLFVGINILNPGYTDILFDDPRGNMLVMGSLGLMAIGIFVMYRLANFEI